MPTSRFSALADAKPGKNRFSSTSEAPSSKAKKSPFSVLADQPTEDNSSTFLDTAMQAGGAILDVISRPNYAVAGAAEELLSPQGGGLGAVPGRVGSELASGIGSIEGQKRGFGEVMERAGVGTGPKLSDVIPWLEGSWFDPSTRGFAGLVGDVFADPLTYLTFGTSGALKAGGKALSEAGGKALLEETAKVVESGAARGAAAARIRQLRQAGNIARNVPLAERGATEETLTLARDMARRKGIGEKFVTKGSAAFVYGEEAEKIAAANVLQAAETAPHLLDRGGIKWLGRTIPGTPQLATAGSRVSTEALDAIGKLPGGASALQSAKEAGKAVDAMVNLLRPGWSVRDMQGVHVAATSARSRIAMQSARWERILGQKVAEFGLGPDDLKRVAIAVDEGTIGALEGKLKAAAEFVRDKGKEVLGADLASGYKIEPVPNYLAHFYDNTPDEWEQVLRFIPDKARSPDPLARHLEERAFETLREAESWSTTAHAANPAVPILKPVYDPFEALRRRGTASIKSRNLRDFEEGLAARYGKDAVVYNGADAFDIGMRKSYQMTPQDELTVQKLLRIEDAINAPREASLQAFRGLSESGKRSFFLERTGKAESPDEVARLMERYREFADYFPRKTKYLGDVAPNGEPWVPVTLRGMGTTELPKSLAEYVGGLDRRMLSPHTPEGKGLKTFLDAYDWTNNTFKLAVTTFPAFHARNAYNNALQSFAEVGASIFDPRNTRDAIAMLRGGAGDFVDKAGRRYGLDALKSAFEEAGIIVPGNSMWEYAGRPMNKTAFRRAIEKRNAQVGGAIENEGRIAHALSLMRRGVSLEDTVASVNKTLVNYQDVTDFGRNWMRRIFPFWQWNYSNARFQYDTLMHRPGLLAAQIKPFRGRESENQQMTSWEAGAMKLRLDGDGKTVRMITGVDLPIRNLDLLWRGSASKTALGVIGMMAPPIKTGMELGFNKSAFTGKEFSRAESGLIGRMIEHAPKFAQRWLGFDNTPDTAGRPKYTFDGQRFYLLAQSWAASRLISTSDRQFREWSKDPNTAGILLDVLTGLRAKELNLSDEQEKLLQERQRELEKAKIRAGEMREFRRSYTPK